MARFNYITVGFPEGFTAEVKHEHHGYTSDEHSRLIIAEEKNMLRSYRSSVSMGLMVYSGKRVSTFRLPYPV